MNKTTTMTMCVVMLMIGMAFTAVAATRSDSNGATSLDVSGVDNLGSYIILNESFTVVKDPSVSYCGYSFSDTDVIVDMEEIPETGFAGSNIRTLVLTENVRSVAEDAFARCDKLISVSRAGTGELAIAKNAFKDCNALRYIDLRGDATVEDGAFPSRLTAMRAMDMDGEAPYSSGDAVRVKDTGGEINVTMFDGTYLRVSFGGKGMLQLVDGNGERARYTTDASTYTTDAGAYITYMFTPFEGKDMTLGYRVVHIKYHLDGTPDVYAEVTDTVYELMDLAEGAADTAWRGWKVIESDPIVVINSFDHAFVDRYCNNSGSVLDLFSESSSYTIYFMIGDPVAGETNVPYLSPTGGNGTTKYPSIRDSEHYTCVGWVRSDDATGEVHPCGSYVRYFGLQYLNAVWVPKADCIYSVQYTNADGSDLGQPEKVGWGSTVTVRDTVSYDETPTRMIDGWRLEGSEDVLRTGDTFTVQEDTRLTPVLRDRNDVVVTFDDGGEVSTMTVKERYPTPITVEDPKEASRLFTGWTMEGTDWALMNGDSISADKAITLTSTWRDKQPFTVSYVSDGLQIGSTQTVLETDSACVHADVSKEHFVLTGWSDGKDVVADGSDYVVTGDVTFTAVWKEMEKYTVRFHLDDGTVSSAAVYVGDTLTIDVDPGTRQGCDFLGWSAAGGSVAEYVNGGSLEAVADVDLYPVWARSPDPLPGTGDGPDGEDGKTDAGEDGDTGGDTSSGDTDRSETGEGSGPTPAPVPTPPSYGPGEDDDPVVPVPVPDVPGDGSDGGVDAGDTPIGTADESGSGSGGWGIGTGVGIAVLAAVSALVVAFLAVMYRRS